MARDTIPINRQLNEMAMIIYFFCAVSIIR